MQLGGKRKAALVVAVLTMLMALIGAVPARGAGPLDGSAPAPPPAYVPPEPDQPVQEVKDVCGPSSNYYKGTDARVHIIDDSKILDGTKRLDGHRVLVITPTNYQPNAERYPVVYLLHGGFSSYGPDEWLQALQTLAVTYDKPWILVIPDGGTIGYYSDWKYDPGIQQQWESFHIKTLIPYIDANYPTIPDRSHRAVAGLSMGGFGALHYAARHPELFSSAAAFSSPLNTRAASERAGYPLFPYDACPDGQLNDINRIWGSPYIEEVNWADNNPTDIAANLHDVDVYLSSGDGTPCPGTTDADSIAAYPAGDGWIEAQKRTVNDDFDAAFQSSTANMDRTAAYTYVRKCGLHDYANWDQSFKDWVDNHAPFQADAPTPAAFSYRTARDVFDVWDWHFDRTEPNRAEEFVYITDASAQGLTLQGSGPVSVTTAPLFHK
ncbi:MAG: hypothetical protein QOC92_1202, partial [Acidimicrobiaceae bacterium]